MLLKRRKLIFATLAVLLTGLLLWGIFFYFSVPRLSRAGKELIRTEYFNRYCQGDMEKYQSYPLIWYDENGYVETDCVWRYVGTYGDCYALLAIGKNMNNNLLEMIEKPFPIMGLSREVLYPIEAYVYLYHTKREFNSDEAPWLDDYDNPPIRMERLYKITWWTTPKWATEKWITDEQLEQLTRDIEKIAKEHNLTKSTS